MLRYFSYIWFRKVGNPLNNNGIYYVLINSGYQIMNSKVPFIKFFCKRDDDNSQLNIVGCVSGVGKYNLSAEQLDNIAFQVERKFLLSGTKSVDIIFMIYSENFERDKAFSDGKSKFWIVDMLGSRLVVFENQPEDFDGLKVKVEEAIFNIAKEVDERKNKRIDVKKLPWITFSLILLNIIFFIWLEIGGSTYDPLYMLSKGALYYKNVLDGNEYYRLFTAMFMHYGFAHLFDNMFSLALLGHEAEKFYGRIKYIVIYILSGIIGNIASVLYFQREGIYAISAGASGAIYGVIGALIVKIIEEKGKSRNALGKILVVLLLLYSAGRDTGTVDNVAHIAGLAAGFIIGSVSYFLFGIRAKNVEKQ